MDTKALFDLLSTFEPLSESFRKSLTRELIPHTFQQNKILLDASEVSTHCYYLQDGFAMSYTYYDGKKIAEGFWKAGEIIIAFKSFFEQIPSDQSIQLMTKGDLLGIHYTSVKQLMEIYPEALRIYSAMLSAHYDSCQNRIRDIQRLSAAVRLKNLLRGYPRIEQHVSQENIASYLGITPQSLSRIKREGK